jgi:hypothetical protein
MRIKLIIKLGFGTAYPTNELNYIILVLKSIGFLKYLFSLIFAFVIHHSKVVTIGTFFMKSGQNVGKVARSAITRKSFPWAEFTLLGGSSCSH